MSELPELRAAIRATAERRYGRRRARVARRSLPAVALAAVVVVALVLIPSTLPDGTPGTDEVPATPTPAATSTPSDAPIIGQAPGTETRESAIASLASVYGAFRRPTRVSDRLEDAVEDKIFPSSRALPKIELDLANARRLAIDGDRVLYAIPGLQNGHVVLCTFATRSSRPASAGCGPFNPDQAHTRPRWSKTFYRPAPVYSLLVPDGTKTVDVHLKSGKVVTKRVQDNAVLFAIKGLARMTWRDANGTQHSTRAAI